MLSPSNAPANVDTTSVYYAEGYEADAIAVAQILGKGTDAVKPLTEASLRGAGGDAEESRFGVDGVEAAVGAELHPGDVVADGLDLPAGKRRDHHRHVRLAAGRRERRRDVVLLAVGRGHAEHEHVLGHPTVVAGHRRRDP